MATAHPNPPLQSSRLALALAGAAIAGMFLVNLSGLTFVDPDMWHEMALAREAQRLGHLPWDDRFAYTPTVYPVVHHEWGTGEIMFRVAEYAGAPGIMALKYALTAGVAILCFWTARRRGASWVSILSVAPAIILAGCYGFTTIRAQLFTMLFLALLVNWLDLDERGRRIWMLAWLPIFVIWLNVHAGFVVGLTVLAAHAVEQAIRGKECQHLVILGFGLLGLVVLNPYGASYYGYLADALAMDRPMILEWLPLWKNDPTTFMVYLISVLLVVYAYMQLGWRGMPGLLVLALTAFAALKHTRHLSLYFVVWLSYVPAWLDATPLGDTLQDLWQKRRKWIAGFSAVVVLLCMTRAVPAQFWKMKLPVTIADEVTGRPMYPAGAVDYLAESDFHGNLMVPFVPGGFVMWKLHPNVKVSLDGRYEVAYKHGVLEENEAMYTASPGWEATLNKYATDVLLVPRNCKLAEVIDTAKGWHRVYRDGAFELYARDGVALPEIDHGEMTAPAQFP
jgi:hypothetical protein